MLRRLGIYAYMYTHMHTHTCSQIYECTRLHTRSTNCAYMYIYTCMHIHMYTYSHFHNDCFFFKDTKTLFVDFRTETLRTKLERVHFGSGIETRVFFSGKKKSSRYENESMYVNKYMLHTRSTNCTYMYIYTCMHIHMYTYTHVCIYTCMHIHMYAYTHVYMPLFCGHGSKIFRWLPLDQHLCVCMYLCMYVYVHVCICACIT